jgi:predicted permease
MALWPRLKRTLRGESHRAEIEDELRFHLEMEMADGRDRRGARLRLGNVTTIAENTRAVGIIEWLESALQDARYGLRQLCRTPALASAVVLSLAIGLGANTAIFSLLDAAILKPLPVKDPDSLVIVEWTNEGFPPRSLINNHNGEYRPISGGRHQGSSIPAYLYRRLAREQTAFAPLIGVAAYPDAVAIAIDGSSPQQVNVQYVSTNYFQGLGLLPALGRPFSDDEDRLGGEPVVVVSHRFWVSQLGGGANALDRTFRINTVPARIVGVAPPGFFGLRAGQWTDVYAPLAMKVAFQPSQNSSGSRGEDDLNWWIRPVGRLKPGVSEAAARTEIASLFRAVAVPEGMTVERNEIPDLITLPGRRGFDALNPRDASALWILMLLVGVLLLIVCANVANLLLSRTVSRRRESAVRLALGAARSRVFRQHLIESGLLAIVGGAVGIALGYLFAQTIHLLFQTGRDASNAFDLHIDLRILGFTGALSMVTAFLFGLAPAARAIRADPNDTLKAQSRSVIGGLSRLPRVLVCLQIALCLAALVAAGLLGRSLENLKWTDIGFDRDNLAYATVSPSRAGYSRDRTGPYVDRVRDELARLPGVLQVSPVQTRLLSGGGNWGGVNIPGRPFDRTQGAHLNRVGAQFFETLRIPLLDGRIIEARDIRPDGREAVVVDRLFAKRYFPDENPLGRRFGLGPDESDRYEIVGVVGNSRYNSLRNEAVPAFYQPYRPGGTVHFAIRTTTDAARLAEDVRRAIAAVDPTVAVTEFHTQSALIDRNLRTERLLSFVSGAFGLVALTLAAIGLGGLLAYVVASRTNEIGVRMALGAAAGDVIRMVLRDSLWMVATGILIGLPCAYAVGRFLQTALFGLQPLDIPTTALSFAALLGVALGAALIPARRAASTDPVVALRVE